MMDITQITYIPLDPEKTYAVIIRVPDGEKWPEQHQLQMLQHQLKNYGVRIIIALPQAWNIETYDMPLITEEDEE